MKAQTLKAHLYLRASTKDQDAQRARQLLEQFAADHRLSISGVYADNYSGTKLLRPELLKLLDNAAKGEVLLVESVDRLSRLSQEDWATLKATIHAKGLRLVVADLPTSWEMASKGIAGEVMQVINSMLIDLMATMARLDQEKRVERIRQGIENKKAAEPEWVPKGKSKDQALWTKIQKLLKDNPKLSPNLVAKAADCGVATVYRVKRELKATV